MEVHQEEFRHVIECTVGEDCRKWREGNRCSHRGRIHIGGPKSSVWIIDQTLIGEEKGYTRSMESKGVKHSS